jgi:hypothetical protein
MSIKLNLSLLDSEVKIKNTIIQNLYRETKNIFTIIGPNIAKELRNISRESIKKQPEYDSLKNGALRFELGIPDTNVVDELIDMILNTLSIKTSNVNLNNNKFSISLSIEMLSEQDLETIANSNQAFVEDRKGYKLPWFRWLVFEGVSPIIKNYKVKLGSNPNSRTGNAIMVYSSSNWSVPPKFAGTANNNWIIRAINDIKENTINSMFKKEIMRHL